MGRKIIRSYECNYESILLYCIFSRIVKLLLLFFQTDVSSKQTFLKLKTDIESGTLNADELKELSKASEKDEMHAAIVEENRRYTETCKAK